METTKEMPASEDTMGRASPGIVRHESLFQGYEEHFELSRWWFVSSVFPMIAGTLGPVGLAFSICSLGRPWVQHTSPSPSVDEEIFIPDPAWLTTLKAIQLSVALASNIFLLLDLTRRIRFTIAQPITIIGWYFSTICLICLHAVASGPMMKSIGLPHDETIWSQAFYYGIWAAIIYFVGASLLVVTFWGAVAGHYHYEEDFNLGRSQRTLMLQTIMFLTYLMLGALVFSNIENWSYLDAVYWADVTLFTIGFGDFSVTTVLGRALLMPYVLVGVISLGLVVTSIRNMIIERAGQRLGARAEEKSRRRVLRTMTRKGTDDVLTPLERDRHVEDVSMSEFERRRVEFEVMRTIQKRASSRRRWVAMIISTICWLCLWLCGAVIFYQCEQAYQDWTYFEAVYFCFISLTTIGYGDLVPTSNAGKSFFVFWSLIALPILTILISNAGDTVILFVNEVTIRLGKITVLPGREGLGHNAKQLVHQLTCGRLFRKSPAKAAYCQEFAATRVRETSASGASTQKGKAVSHDTHETSVSSAPLPSQRKAHESFHIYQGKPQNPSKVHDMPSTLPTGDDLHLLLLSEIQKIAKDVQAPEPRRYTFEEWAWYLWLIGEDESDPDSHHKARPESLSRSTTKSNATWKKHKGNRKDKEDETRHEVQLQPGERFKWSWVDDQNPLLTGSDESEWILEKLMDRLGEVLLVAKRQHDDSGSC